MIDPLRAHEALVFICEVLEVPRSSYYDFCCKREQIDVERLNVKLQVKELFVLSRVSLGSRSICCLMTEEGIEIGRFNVSRQMEEMNLVSKRPGGHKYKQARAEHLDTPNSLHRELNVAQPDQVWCSGH